MDYYLDLFVSGEFKIEATALEFHTIDRFGAGSIEPVAEIKCGIECGGSIDMKAGTIYSMSAEVEGKAEAVWKIARDSEKNALVCDYEGLYVIIKTKFKTSSDSKNRDSDNTNPEQPEKKFLLHDGFSYEFKLD